MSRTFPPSSAQPGQGHIHLILLPPRTPHLKTASYQYPLKLISPAPIRSVTAPSRLIHTVYLLTYGGGIVAGDRINLNVILDRDTRLILLTQGSTKLFKSPDRNTVSRQTMNVSLSPDCALCYLPDPVQPFEQSCFEQHQRFDMILSNNDESTTGNLCFLDWVSSGRSANGENWSFTRYGSKNEIHLVSPSGEKRLLLRDNMMLDDAGVDVSHAPKLNGLGVYATLIMCGSMFRKLGAFFLSEFKAVPQIGVQKWDSSSESGGDDDLDPVAIQRAIRIRQEAADGVLWSVASVRGCFVVKFGARDVEGGKRWVHAMLNDEGSIVEEFGDRALLCLR